MGLSWLPTHISALSTLDTLWLEYQLRNIAMSKIDRSTEKFTLIIGGLSEQDRNNPYLLKSLVHEEKVKYITNRVSLPTISSNMRDQSFHPALKGHDVKTIPVWENMPMYDNHFLRRLYDKYGNCRNLNRGLLQPGKSSLLDAGLSNPPPLVPSRECKEVNLQPLCCPPKFSFRRQWNTNQRHFQIDFKRSSKPFT